MIDVGALGDFEEGVARIVKVKNREVGIILWDGRPYALRNTCPHMLGPLAEGVVAPRLCAKRPLDRFEADREAPVLICPWHGWAFDIKTGEVVFEESRGQGNGRFRHKVRRYDAQIVDGRVLVNA